MSYVTRQTQHGTLYLYRIPMEEEGHTEHPHVWAYDAESAIDRLCDLNPDITDHDLNISVGTPVRVKLR